MTERIVPYTLRHADLKAPSPDEALTIQIGNNQEFLLPEHRLVLPSEASEAIISIPYFDTSTQEYPVYVNHEGFLVGPRKLGKHAWLVGSQENKPHTIPINANSILIGNILIDPGSHEGIPYLMENLRHLGKDVGDIEMVLITHAHLDHIEAIDDLQMLGLVAPVLVPEKSIEQIIQCDAKKIGMDFYDHDFHTFSISGILKPDEPVSISGFTVIPRHCPGHSEDSMYFKIIDPNGHTTFVVGDLLIGGDRKEFGSNIVSRKHSLKRFIKDIEREDSDIIAGHHPTVLHKTESLLEDIEGFGKERFDIVPSMPGMLYSYWPL